MLSKTWIAVSTHEGEYDDIQIAHEILKQSFPKSKLVICPRHLFEISQVKQRFQDDDSVQFNETLGNMDPYFKLADLVFVGGTFHPDVGGHNVLEPVSYQKVTLVGPYTDKINDLIEACEEIIQVQNGAELGEKLIELFSDELKCHTVAQSCYAAYLRARESVLESYLDLITPLIDAQLLKMSRI